MVATEVLGDLFDASVDGQSPTRGMLGEGKGEDFAEYADRFGRVRMWHFGNRVGVLESSGGIIAEHAAFIVSYFGKHLDDRPAPRFGFCNWLALTAYSAEVRKILTDWQVAQRYQGLHVAQTSKLLAMSVSLANMVLDRGVRTYAALADVHREFQSTMLEYDLQPRLRGTVSSLRPIR